MRLSVALLVVTCSVLTTEAPPAQAAPPPKTVGIFRVLYTNRCYVSPEVKVVIGQEVVWENTDDIARTVTQLQGFWKFTVPVQGKRHRTMHSAGTFVERCDKDAYHYTYHYIRVPVRAPSKTNRASFKVRWANSGSPAGVRFTVMYRVGTSGFTTWKDRTTRRWAIFHGAHGQTYRFVARSIRAGHMTLWSRRKIAKVSYA
jgi:hypothetical protein